MVGVESDVLLGAFKNPGRKQDSESGEEAQCGQGEEKRHMRGNRLTGKGEECFK